MAWGMLEKLLIILIVAVLLIVYNSVVAVFTKGVGKLHLPQIVATGLGLVFLVGFSIFGLQSIHLESNKHFVIAGVVVGWLLNEAYRYWSLRDEDETADV